MKSLSCALVGAKSWQINKIQASNKYSNTPYAYG